VRDLIVTEEARSVSIVELIGADSVLIPGSPLELWEQGELHDYLHLPHDGTKAEIHYGKIVVTAAPFAEHNCIVMDIADLNAVHVSRNPEHPWRCHLGSGVLVTEIESGYIPDLMFIHADILKGIRTAKAKRPSCDEIEMAVEVTSGNGANDRPPKTGGTPTKWNAYATAGIPYYLLIDRDPSIARITLYSVPESDGYHYEESWKFGDLVELPEQFGLQIPTDGWQTA